MITAISLDNDGIILFGDVNTILAFPLFSFLIFVNQSRVERDIILVSFAASSKRPFPHSIDKKKTNVIIDSKKE